MSIGVDWSTRETCYVFTCDWGCRGSDYESYGEALDAYAGHPCVAATPEQCS